MGCILSCFWCFVAVGWDGWGSGFGCCVGRFLWMDGDDGRPKDD